MFKSLIGKDHPEFKTGRQQDALEYFNHFLDKVARGETAGGRKNPMWIFDFEIQDKLQC